MQASSERKRNQRKSPLTPKKGFKKEDSPPAIAMRVGGRLKKAKIPFDPSDAVIKRRQTDSCLSVKKCPTVIAQPVQSNCCHCEKIDKPELLVKCKGGCASKIHLTCLQSIYENFVENEERTWECLNCQSCCICCKGTINGKPLLKCYICFKYYHLKCHGTEDNIKIVKQNRFYCGSCEKGRRIITPNAANEAVPKKTRAFAQTRVKPVNTDSKFSNDGNVGFLGFNANEVVESSTDDETNRPTNSKRRRTNSIEYPIKTIQRSSSDKRNSIDDEAVIPDASKWSSDEVFRYFKTKFPRDAHVFKDQEIDGASLYLLKRGDVVKGFNIKIGPALKIYGQILKLQTKSKDVTLTWH